MSDNKSRYIKKIQELLVKEVCEDNEEEKLKFLQLAKVESENFLFSFPKDADASHLMGLVYYHFPETENIYKAQQHFQEAVRKDSNHHFALMYLGHCYFDTKNFAEALDCFEKIDKEYFIKSDKKWRVIKLLELILCCRIRLNLSDNFVTEFNDFVNELENTPEEDVANLNELTVTFAETKESLIWQKVPRKKLVSNISRVLRKFGYTKTSEEFIE